MNILLKHRSKLLVLALATMMTATLQAQDWEWGSLPSGGGGYITGIVFHPLEKDLIYIRTDVGGIYRYEPAGNGHTGNPYWQQLMEWVPVETTSLWSTDGIAINPMNAEVLFAALGPGAGDSYINSDPYPQGVYKSTDRGVTWRQVLNKRFRGNQGHRSTGECLAVIPEGNGNVVLAGTRFEGLFRSIDGGETWKRVTTVPTDSKGVGIRCVAFDPTTPSNVWLTAYNAGVYRSTDKGETFSLVDGTADINPREVKVSQNGTTWITSKKGTYKVAGGALVKCNPSSSVIDYNAIAIDPTNGDHVVITQQLSAFKTKIFRTTNNGSSWQTITNNKTFVNHVPWYKDDHMGAAIAAVAFNPFDTRQLWFTDWYLPWKTDDVTAPSAHYESVPWGVEELCVFDIATPPSAALLYNACADNGGLRHETMNDYPTVRFGEQESTGIDFCELRPECVVRVSSNSWGASGFRVSRSDDAGKSWRTVYTPKTTGKVAYSATDVKNYIYIPTNKSVIPLYTKDDGVTWNEVSGLPQNTYNKEFWNNYNKALVSDRVEGGTFYALISGKCYRSIDGGTTFVQRCSGLPTPSSSASPAIYMATSPYAKGDIWVSIGGKGIWHSTDGGAKFVRIEEFTDAKVIAVGPALTTGGSPLVFTYAKQESLGWGVWYSDDDGNSWGQMNDDSFQASNDPRQMAADRNCPGRVFIGSGGRGIYYGALKIDGSHIDIPRSDDFKVSYHTDTHRLRLQAPEGAGYRILSKEGKTIANGCIEGTDTHIDMSSFGNALLLVEITSEKVGRRTVKIFI